ncbi:MAG: recombinase family protein [Oscillospiraceae bacterium]|nr:recombinase family protein [Oscillospiraceae bacterium]
MYNAHYGRQSVDKKDSISVESQLDFCKYESRGEKYKEYVDKGFSGKNTNRPAFTQLCSDIEQGLIEKVIVYKLDRISRSILDFSNMMEFFHKHNVEFVSSTEKFDTSTPMGRAMLNICIVFAQLERETIQKRSIDTHYSRCQKGFYMGGNVPYGYRLEKTIVDGIKTSKYVLIPEAEEQIKLIFSLYSNPQTSIGDILIHLNNNHIKNIQGKLWDRSRVTRIIYNAAYVRADPDVYDFFKSQGANIVGDVSDFIGTNGCYLYTNEENRNKPKSIIRIKNKILVLAPHEGIISSQEWLQCRIKSLANKQFHRGKGKHSWLIGKVRCGLCNSSLTIAANLAGTKYFRCRGKYNEKNGCLLRTVRVDSLEPHVFQEMKNKLSEFKILCRQKNRVSDPKINKHKIRITQIDKEIESLLEKVAGANSILMKYINEKIEILDIERKQLQENILILSKGNSGTDVGKISDYINQWNKINFDEKYQVVDCLIKVIHVKDGKLEITWKV